MATLKTITDWEYSNETEKEKILPEEGNQWLLITDARFDEDDKIYTVFVKSLTNQAEFQLRYWMDKADENGNIVPNTASRGTLLGLSKALDGPDSQHGILRPEDIIGGVVLGQVVIKNGYARIYRYFPCPEEIVSSYSSLEGQYFTTE